MDEDHTAIPHGRVLVRNEWSVALWQGPLAPEGVVIGDAGVVRAGPQDLLFPSLINLHSHPRENHLHAWPAPSSHALPAQGKAGTDPCANRYQCGNAGSPTAPPELGRLVSNPADVLAEDLGLGLRGEVVTYAEVAAVLGAETGFSAQSRERRRSHQKRGRLPQLDLTAAAQWLPALRDDNRPHPRQPLVPLRVAPLLVPQPADQAHDPLSRSRASARLCPGVAAL